MKRYNALTAQSKHAGVIRTPMLAMQKSGQFRVNRTLLAILGASVGDGVELLCDDSGEWYIAKADKDGLILCVGQHGSCTFHSSIVAREIRAAIEDDRGTFAVATNPHIHEGQKCYAILLSSKR